MPDGQFDDSGAQYSFDRLGGLKEQVQHLM